MSSSFDVFMDTIKMFASSQGSYGRMLRDIQDMALHNHEAFYKLREVVEEQNFTDPVEVVMFLEC